MNEFIKTKNTSLIQVELHKEFLRRRKINPQYSLRAYANFLEVDQSLLSKIMNKRRSLSEALIEQLSTKLRIRNKLVGSEISIVNHSLNSEAINFDSTAYINLLEDEVSLLENWLHFAVLELIKTKDFKSDARWMAQRFGVHKSEMDDVLSRLERRGFIQRNDKKITLIKANVNWLESIVTSEARREMQRQLLKKSLESLDEIPFKDREHASLTIAVQRDKLPELKKKINEICLNMDSYIQSNQNEADEVYQVNFSFFPLTKLKKLNH